MKIRLTGELKQSIEQAATAAGRTMNAEVVNRLQDSFETVPTERIKELQLQLAQQHAKTLHEQSKSLQYSAALMMIASRVPPEAFADTPALAEILQKATVNRKAQLLASAQQMLVDAVQTIADIDQQIATIQTKPVKTQDAKNINRP